MAKVSSTYFPRQSDQQPQISPAGATFPAFVADFDPTRVYEEGELVLESGAVYVAPGAVAAGVFDAADWTLVGSDAQQLPFQVFSASVAYPAGSAVLQGGKGYLAASTVAAGPFDAADWVDLSATGGGAGGDAFPAFSAATAYTAGQGVLQAGRLFVAPGAVSAGGFNQEQWTELLARDRFVSFGATTPDQVLTLNFAAGQAFEATAGNNVSLAFTNARRGDQVQLYLRRDGSPTPWGVSYPATAELTLEDFDPARFDDALIVIRCLNDGGSPLFDVRTYGRAPISTLVMEQQLADDVTTFFGKGGSLFDADVDGKLFSILKDLESYRRRSGRFRFRARWLNGVSQIGTDWVWEQTSNPVEFIEAVQGYVALEGESQLPNAGGICLSSLAAQGLSVLYTNTDATSALAGVLQAKRNAYQALAVTTIPSHGAPGAATQADRVQLYVE